MLPIIAERKLPGTYNPIESSMRPFALRLLSWALISLSIIAGAAVESTWGADPTAHKIKVLIVTGGHEFEPKAFLKLFDDKPNITYKVCKQAKPAEAWDRDDLADYDVVLLYDFQNEINDTQKARFLSLFRNGTGLIVLHHALLSYQGWPEYERIAGGKYLLDNEKSANGKSTPASTYQADVDMEVKIAAKDHPVTAGVGDFHMRDEIYRGVRNTPDIKVLATAEGRPLAWARDEKKSRVFGIIVGHGPGSYNDPNFQKLLSQAIRWTSGRDRTDASANAGHAAARSSTQIGRN